MNLDLTPMEKAIAQLAGTLDAYNNEPIFQTNQEYKKYMRSAVIQSFEFTYELTLKMIARYLKEEIISPAETANMNFRNIVDLAYMKNIIRSDISVWSQYRENRGITSHTYNEEKAQDVFESASEFLHEAQYALTSLQNNQSGSSSLMPKKVTKQYTESEIANIQPNPYKPKDAKDKNNKIYKKTI